MNNILIVMTDTTFADALLRKAIALQAESIHGFAFDNPPNEVEAAFAKQIGSDKQIKTEIIINKVHKEDSKYDSLVATLQLNKWDLVILPRPQVGTDTEELFFARKVLQECPIPALLLCGKEMWSSPLKVLATIDVLDDSEPQSALNKVVLQYCHTLSELLLTDNTAVSVIPISRISQEFDIVEPGDVVAEKGKMTQEKLEHTIRSAEPLMQMATTVVAGTPSREISSVAAKLDANLVVMGNVARKGLGGLFIGNTAERILTCLTTDVLVVRG